MRRVWTRIAVVTVVLGVSASWIDARDDVNSGLAEARELGRAYTQQFYDKKLEPLRAKFSTEMAEAMSLEQFTEVRAQLDAQLGPETEMLEDGVETKDDYLVYERRAKFEKYPGVIVVRWVLKEGGAIAGVFLTPEQ